MRFAQIFAVALLAASGSESLAGPLQPTLVQPSGAELPANLLRISLVFPAPPGEPVLPHLGLRRANGEVVDRPFLEQELWSPSGKILTILLHPGRVKRGLNARETLGPVLTSGDSVTLTLDGKDVKRWRVGPEDHDGPTPSSWRLSPVKPGSKDVLVVELDGPIDGRDVDYLAVVDDRDRRVPGQARLTDGERTWTFTPATPWGVGDYQLGMYGYLEDAAGNRLGSRFEATEASRPEPTSDVAIPFSVTRLSRHRSP